MPHHFKPHDALFKTLFGEHATVVADALRALLPGPLFDALDLSTLERVDAELIDADLRRRRADVLYRVQLAGHPVLIYLLFEQQQTPERLMAYRSGEYVFRIWGRLIRRHQKEHGCPPTSLPAVIPIVVHTGPRPWTAPRRIEELIALPPALLPLVEPFVPRLTLLLDDLPAISDAELRARPAEPLTRLGWLLFRHAATDPDLLTRLRSWGEDLAAVWRRDGEEISERLFRYILLVNDGIERDTLSAVVGEVVGEDAKEWIMTAGERLFAEGEQKGRERGAAEGQQRMIFNLLRLKFGALPDEVISRVEQADVPQLDVWAARILTATTLAEVFAS